MATAFTTYTDGTDPKAGSGGNYAGSPERTVLVGVFDATRRNLAVNLDTIPILQIPAGFWVEAVVIEVLTPDAASQTISVGDVTDPNGWVVAAPTDAAAGTKVLGAGAYAIATGTSQTNGKFYAAATDLLLENDTGKTATIGKFKVSVIGTLV